MDVYPIRDNHAFCSYRFVVLEADMELKGSRAKD